ncbi:heat-shock protein Hsp20 [Reticulibacter mediterranei]|uniref:Heat-shock protein Hsp20 n=1 Tax=Reticulibacter mediterranei TaxID=2778369 RepID=A0A8J3INJ2_9CHLR|nr:Hsp20 family protein [Reticulibacter mediterranei]GHO95668.1 heat-shock protein Hsp20 [Reticulibacter mediterranei]
MISRYDPFREALSLRRAMDQLFEQSFIHPGMMVGTSSQMVPMDLCETQNGYELDVSLPGVRPEDIELTVDQNTLTIRGHYSHQNEHQQQNQAGEQGQQTQQQPQQQTQMQAQQGRTQRHRQGHTWLAHEMISGSFERSVTFPKPIDPNNIQTNFQNGILTIQVPVSEASRPRRISISGSQGQQEQKTIDVGKS